MAKEFQFCLRACAIALFLMASMVFAACGGSEATDATPASTTDQSTPAPDAERTIASVETTITARTPDAEGSSEEPSSTSTATGTASTTTRAVPARTSADTDLHALTVIYEAMGGEEGRHSSTQRWFSDSPVGNWENIDTDEDGRVINLEIEDLSGQLPPEIGDLVQLEELRIVDNVLTGGIPPELGNLVNLKLLRISREPARLGDSQRTGFACPVGPA